MKPADVAAKVVRAESRIRPYIRETILEYSPYLSRFGHASVYCKLENLQHTGSFKLRGAMNKLLSLSEIERRRGVVTASTGNHGAAVVYGLNRLGTAGTFFVPETASADKVKSMQLLGAEVRYFGQDTADTEVHARAFADEQGIPFISPYNDPQVVAGQGTIGLELTRQIEHIDAAFVAIGGGGLISGVAGYLKSTLPHVRIVGCSPENSQVMIQSIKAGRILDLPSLPTLSDGTAGGIEPGTITFALCRAFVDEYVTVTEDEIRESLLRFMQAHHMLIEGAAAVAVASYVKVHERFAGQNVAIVICGANISLDTLKRIL